MDISDDPLLLAMQFLKSAIGILDGAGAPADIGAHVDVAIFRIGEELARYDQEGNEARQ
jgi:hypothetical protein